MERLEAIARRQHQDLAATDPDHEDPPSGTRVETIIVGLSGPSSSGKTTLARLLREIFSLDIEGLKISLSILHQDDDYKMDKEAVTAADLANFSLPTSIPIVTVTSKAHGIRELQDWDCIDSIDLPLFEHTLKYLHDHGSLPPDSVSKEDQNSVGESHVSSQEVEEWKGKVTSWLENVVKGRASDSSNSGGEQESGSGGKRETRIYIVDGFLLYPPPPSSPPSNANIYPHTQEGLDHLYNLTCSFLHPKLFIPSTRQQTLTRRAARSGYVTLEGFWTDPPGYIEDVVWPNYIHYQSWMYKGGDVDANIFDEEICDKEKVRVCPGGGQWAMHEVLEWAIQRVKEAVEERV